MGGIDVQFPHVIDRYLQRVLYERSHPLLLSFNRGWQLIEVQGDAAYFGLDIAAPETGVRILQNLFLGLPTNQSQNFPFVELSPGRHAQVHLIPDNHLFYVLLLDTTKIVGTEQEATSTALDSEQIGSEKSKSLVKLRQIRSELERQRTRLEEANSLKNALIATLSHEFRTPLTSIFGYLHLLERHSALDENANQALRAIRRSATYLFSLAENLLEYGRGEAGGGLLNPVETNLEELRGDLDAMFRPLALEKGLTFCLELILASSASAIFDEVKLKQILINLLSNAVRYTASGEVKATIEWRHQQLAIEVRDTGIGIPAEFHDTVFTPFNRGAQAGSRGAGLGLSIVKRLVEQMHGTLDLDSIIGEGTRFTVRLPSLKQPGAEPMAVLEPPVVQPVESWAARYHALVVDDDPDVANLLDVLLTDLGFQVRLVGDGIQALTEARGNPPDILLVDVDLPGLSGNAAVYRLRSQGYTGHIITLSATATEEARDAAISAGCDFFLSKPLNVEQFTKIIQRMLSIIK